MSETEKAPYVQKVVKREGEYNKNMQAYNLKLAGGGADDEEYDKSKSEVNNEDEKDVSGEDFGLSLIDTLHSLPLFFFCLAWLLCLLLSLSLSK